MNNYIALSKQDLKENADKLIQTVQVPVIAVVKCNGYGLGIENAVRIWHESGIRFFAVSKPDEALKVRELGYEDIDILLLAPVWDEDTLHKLQEASVITTVTSAAHARLLADICPDARVHVKVNVGMGRFGLKYSKTQDIAAIYRQENLRFEGIFAHFPESFAKDSQETVRQLAHFTSLTDGLKEQGIDVGIRHIANSCGALRFPEARLDAVRIGSALTGRLPCAVPCELKRIGMLRAQVADTVELEPGDTSGYSMVCRIKCYTHGAVVTAGYTDGWGLERHIPALSKTDVLRRMYHALRDGVSRESVIWQGRKLSVLGRIGTQYTVIDRADSGLKPGDWVEIPVNIMLADSRLARVMEE